MSGITGLFHLDRRLVDPALVEQMTLRIAHRGPDSSGLWFEGAIGLGHCLFWTTPESLYERQPLCSKGASLVLTADARIDNRTELISALGLERPSREEITDSELILAAYAKWGEACPQRLVGDFAFVIWDGRRQQMFCARDPFGIKPFYYYYQPNRIFAFASEIKALLCLPDVPCQLNEVRVGNYLTRNFEDKAITFYKGIQRLLPATSLSISPQNHHWQRFWEPRIDNELKLNSDEEYESAFREVFTKAVACRLRSAFPVGATLSGGLDSSAVACVAANVLSQQGKAPLHTFSAIFAGLAEVDPTIDERAYMEAVTGSGYFIPHYVEADRLPLLFPSLWQDDEALPAINLYIDNALFRAANQQGVRVVLTGHDGDTVISYGYERITQLMYEFKWLTMLRESTALSQKFNVKRSTVLWQRGLKSLFPQSTIRLWRKLRKREQQMWDDRTLIHSDFARDIGLSKRVKSDLAWQRQNALSWRIGHWEGINSGLLQFATELDDKIAATAPVEVRHPFFDRQLVEFCLALPLSQKLRNGWPRAILRYALADLLPPAVCWRLTKGNLSANYYRGLIGRERETIERVIIHDPVFLAKYVNTVDLQQAYYRYTDQPHIYVREAITVGFSVVLALWLRHSGLATLAD